MENGYKCTKDFTYGSQFFESELRGEVIQASLWSVLQYSR